MTNDSEHNSLWTFFAKLSVQKLSQFLTYFPLNISFMSMLPM